MFLLSGLVGTSVRSQTVTPEVRAVLSPDSISIGDHFTLEVTVSKDIMQVVDFPRFQGTLGNQLDLLKEMPIDTIAKEGRRHTLSKKYRLTTVYEGNYDLGRFPVLYMDKNIVDTLYSIDSLHLLVTTFPIDTATQTIYDVKPPVDTPLLLSEIKGYLLGGAILLAVLVSSIYFLLNRRKGNSVPVVKPATKEPPHVRAIRELEQLHNQKVWQNNKHKLYYTRLTDILREYLGGRYGIRAMEMTSDEILDAMKEIELPGKNASNLHELLRTADLVKFAKYVPDADRNEEAYTNLYYFVEDTKEMPEEKPVGETGPDNIQMS